MNKPVIWMAFLSGYYLRLATQRLFTYKPMFLPWVDLVVNFVFVIVFFSLTWILAKDLKDK